MSVPLGKRTRMPVASRPWNLREPQPDQEDPRREETEKQKMERQICLTCDLPGCTPEAAACPLYQHDQATKKPVYHKSEALKEFLAWAWGPMTNREWAEKLGVSPSTISRWRKEYANEIKKRRP